jgi:hypothetical protein
MNDRPTDSGLFPEDYQDGEIEQGPADAELEGRIDDWTTQDNAENIQPCATLYKYLDPTQGNDKAQVNYYRGNVPTRHEIVETYGSGRYMLVLTRPAGKKQPRKSTSFRFPLHANYDRLKALKDEADARKIAGSTGVSQYAPTIIQPANNAAIFKETFGMMQGMMSSIFAMLSPLLLKAQEPRQIAPPTGNPTDSLGMFTALKDVLKAQTKSDIDFFTEMKKGLLSMERPTDPDDLDEAAPEEKKSMLERLLAIAEPFIPILAQNTTQARIAAAGIKAMPQVQAAVKSITASPELLQRVVEYVETKEGRDGAIIALRNMGIQTAVSRSPTSLTGPTGQTSNPRKMVPHIHGKRKDGKK